MGMIGCYTAVDDTLLNRIVSGEQDILEIDPKQYPALDIDKSWHAIHYLLCGEAGDGRPPMGYVVPLSDDTAIECNLDYGAFGLTAQQVQEAAEYLNTLDDAAIKELYDFPAMLENDIYPLYSGDNEAEFYEYLHANLVEVKNYFAQMAEKGFGVIFYIS